VRESGEIGINDTAFLKSNLEAIPCGHQSGEVKTRRREFREVQCHIKRVAELPQRKGTKYTLYII
jgi:hypothetical protein